jgi:hypothetical protein
MPEKKNKSTSVSEWKLLKEASKEVESWPNWLQKNAELLFEEEQEKQRKLDKIKNRSKTIELKIISVERLKLTY